MMNVFVFQRYVVAVLLAVLCCLSAGLVNGAALPQTAILQYEDDHGLPVTMTFNQQNQRYAVQTELNVILYRMNFTSEGRVINNQLLPESYTDRRSGKLYAQAIFDGRTVRYGKAKEAIKQQQLDGMVYDVFTLAWQLALSDGKLPQPTYFTNGKRIYALNHVEYLGQSTYLWNQEPRLIHSYRLREGRNTIDYAFIPSLGNIPAQISYTDDNQVYVLKLKKAQLDEK